MTAREHDLIARAEKSFLADRAARRPRCGCTQFKTTLNRHNVEVKCVGRGCSFAVAIPMYVLERGQGAVA